MPPKGKYSDPKLRDQVKEEVQNSDKGGEPGQWSARKAQFMASEYKKRGGGYTTDKESGQDESQKNLSKWSEEEWQTKEGSGAAKQDDGTRKRYLPKKAWEQMDEKEKEETDEKKQEASGEGQQFVQNTDKAKGARQKANEQESEQFEEKKSKQAKGKKQGTGKQADGSEPRRSGRGASKPAEEKKDEKKEKAPARGKKSQAKDAPRGSPGSGDDEEFEDPGVDDDVAQEHPDSKDEQADSKDSTMDAPQIEKKDDDKQAGQKRGRGKKADDSNKKQKTDNTQDGKGKNPGSFGSKHDDPKAPAPAASVDRLPKKGQRVSWKALPGWVHGETVEVVTETKEINGKTTKASKDDPRIVVKSDNGKTAVHKVDKVHFE